MLTSGSLLRGRSSSGGSVFSIDMMSTRFGSSFAGVGAAGVGAGVGVIVLDGGAFRGFKTEGTRCGDGGRTARRAGLKGRAWG